MTIEMKNINNSKQNNSIFELANNFVEKCNIIVINLIVLAMLGGILMVPTLLIFVYEFTQDKISFYKIERQLKNVDLDQTLKKLKEVNLNKKDKIWYNRLFSLNSKPFELEQLKRITTDDQRYNGTVLKMKNLTNNICKIETIFFDQLFGQYDFIEIQNTSLKPNEETLVYLAYKNLAFDGYHTKSINHTSLLMLDEYSSLPEEFLAYKIINKLLSDEYTSLEWKFAPEQIARLKKDSSNSIYAHVDLSKILNLKENIDDRMFFAESMFRKSCCENNTIKVKYSSQQ
jgi:hypothetical protein